MIPTLPTEFSVDANVQQHEPFNVEVRIGPKVTFVVIAALAVALVWKKL